MVPIKVPNFKDYILRALHPFISLLKSRGLPAIADQALASGTNFVISVIIARACTKEDLGYYALGYTILIFGINLQDCLISSPYTIYSPHLKGIDLKKYTGSSLILQISLSLILSVALLIGGVVIVYTQGSTQLSQVISSIAFSISFILFREYCRRICFARLWMDAALFMDLCLSAIQITIFLLFAYYGFLSVKLAFIIIGGSCALLLIYWLFRYRSIYAFSVWEAISDMRRNWSMGKWLIVSNLANIFSLELYPWFLAISHGIEATGIFAAAMGVVALCNPFIMGMANYLAPRTSHAMAHGGIVECIKIVKKGTFILSIIIGTFFIITIPFGDQIVTLIYGHKYSGHGLIVGILALSLFVSVLTISFNYAFMAIGKSDLLFKSYLPSIVVTLSFGLALTKFLGPVGVALGLLLGNSSVSIARYFLFEKQFKDSFRQSG